MFTRVQSTIFQHQRLFGDIMGSSGDAWLESIFSKVMAVIGVVPTIGMHG